MNDRKTMSKENTEQVSRAWDNEVKKIKLEFESEIKRLSLEGTQYSKLMIESIRKTVAKIEHQMEEEKKFFIEKLNNLDRLIMDERSYFTSKIGSQGASINYLYDDFLPETKKQISIATQKSDVAIKIGRDACEAVLQSKEKVEEAKEAIKDFKMASEKAQKTFNSWALGVFIAILISMLGLVVPSCQRNYQAEKHQTQLMEAMQQLSHELINLNGGK